MTKTRKKHRIVCGTGNPGGHRLIPEIRQVGWGKFAVADPRHLAPHRHRGAFELCLILSGEVEWETQDESYMLRAGDIFITRPDELHWGRDRAMQPCTLYWLHLDAGQGDGWLDLPYGVGAALRERLMSVPRQLRGDSARIACLFQQIFDEHRINSLDPWQEALRQASARASVQQLVIELVRLSEAPQDRRQPRSFPPGIERAIAVIRDPKEGSLSNRQIAASVGASVADLNALFTAHVGMSLTQFSLRERMRVARAKLSETHKSVTEIANELGFSSSQHFATAFKRMTGASPTTYRSSNRPE